MRRNIRRVGDMEQKRRELIQPCFWAAVERRELFQQAHLCGSKINLRGEN